MPIHKEKKGYKKEYSEKVSMGLRNLVGTPALISDPILVMVRERKPRVNKQLATFGDYWSPTTSLTKATLLSSIADVNGLKLGSILG